MRLNYIYLDESIYIITFIYNRKLQPLINFQEGQHCSHHVFFAPFLIKLINPFKKEKF